MASQNRNAHLPQMDAGSAAPLPTLCVCCRERPLIADILVFPQAASEWTYFGHRLQGLQRKVG
jgi:hypothetical protein